MIASRNLGFGSVPSDRPGGRSVGSLPGTISPSEAKDRMEFHPGDLRRQGLYDEALALCENSKRASARLLTFPANRRYRSHQPEPRW